MSSAPDPVSALLRHERLIVGLGIALLVGVSWWFLVSGAGLDMGIGMSGATMAPPPFAALVLMWWLMMVAMMLPSAAPAILLYARVRQMRRGDAVVAQTWVFLAGYITMWLAFSLAAAAAQHVLVGGAMALVDARALGALPVLVGAYQISPLKSACLRQCRSPAQFISSHWRPGTYGTFRLGVSHGLYCVGCCWMLMALLFVGGIMNFAWIAALTLVVGIEKLVPGGEWIGKAVGIALIGGGAASLLA